MGVSGTEATLDRRTDSKVSESRSMSKPLIATLIVAASALLYVQPPAAGVAAGAMHAAAMIAFAVGMWAFNVLPEHITGILFLLLTVVLGVASPAVVFSGFTSSTLWLVFGGLFVAEAVRATGLGQRLARLLLARFTGSYPAILVGVSLVATFLAFLMPATMGRVLLLVPVMSALAGRMGFAPGSNGYNGIMLSALAGTYHAGIGILPANAPNMVLAGAAETLYRVELIYGTYFLLRFPIWSIIKIAICIAFTLLLFPARPERAEAETRLPAVSSAEWRLMMILGAALALWATDFLHHIHAGWIALAAAMTCILPGIGVLPLDAFNERIRFGPFFYIGAVLGLGGIMTESGLTAAVGDRLVKALDLQAGADALNFGILIAAATATGLLTTSAAQPALLAPLAGEIAEGIGWAIPAVLMTLAAGYSTVLLPHTVPPIVVGLRVANVPFRDAIRYMIPTAVVGLVVIVPLDYLWWRLLGYFG
jgi:anion transporter